MDDNYIAGFVDGEGSFHIAFQKRTDLLLVWQVIPEFHISQNSHSKDVLEMIKNRLKCGYVKANHAESKIDNTFVYVVRNRQDLNNKVVPFFNKYRLYTEKRKDFQKFRNILEKIEKNEHLSIEGFSKIVKLAYSMNGNGRYRKVKINKILTTLSSSETICSALSN